MILLPQDWLSTLSALSVTFLKLNTRQIPQQRDLQNLPGSDFSDSSVSEDRLLNGSSVDSGVDRVTDDGVLGRLSLSPSNLATFSLSNSDTFAFWYGAGASETFGAKCRSYLKGYLLLVMEAELV